jgi:hypothetical protein
LPSNALSGGIDKMHITYEEAYDSYHTMFRMFRQREIFRNEENIRVEYFQIRDFYILFPFFVSDIRLRNEDKWLRALAKKWRRPYGCTPSPYTIFSKMIAIQRAALTTLAANEYLNSSALENGVVEFSEKEPPREIHELCSKVNLENEEQVSAVKYIYDHYKLNGENGIKSRSGLMEYKYDLI